MCNKMQSKTLKLDQRAPYKNTKCLKLKPITPNDHPIKYKTS